MDAKAALKTYRQSNTSKSMREALAGFQSMSITDRLELLFWLCMSTNTQILPMLKILNIGFTVNKEPEPEN